MAPAEQSTPTAGPLPEYGEGVSAPAQTKPGLVGMVMDIAFGGMRAALYGPSNASDDFQAIRQRRLEVQERVVAVVPQVNAANQNDTFEAKALSEILPPVPETSLTKFSQMPMPASFDRRLGNSTDPLDLDPLGLDSPVPAAAQLSPAANDNPPVRIIRA
ncbi:MAG TPA: hypothetical protein PK765_03555 [bacterium]|nr:hypothetical protein [bacterium]